MLNSASNLILRCPWATMQALEDKIEKAIIKYTAWSQIQVHLGCAPVGCGA